MSQQPYQPGQPGGYPQGQPGYPQGGYQQPGQYGGYPGATPPTRSSSGNPLNSAATLAPILQILGLVVAVVGVIGSFFAFAIDAYPGSLKFVTFAAGIVASLGFAGVLLALSVMLKRDR